MSTRGSPKAMQPARKGSGVSGLSTSWQHTCTRTAAFSSPPPIGPKPFSLASEVIPVSMAAACSSAGSDKRPTSDPRSTCKSVTPPPNLKESTAWRSCKFTWSKASIIMATPVTDSRREGTASPYNPCGEPSLDVKKGSQLSNVRRSLRQAEVLVKPGAELFSCISACGVISMSAFDKKPKEYRMWSTIAPHLPRNSTLATLRCRCSQKAPQRRRTQFFCGVAVLMLQTLLPRLPGMGLPHA